MYANHIVNLTFGRGGLFTSHQISPKGVQIKNKKTFHVFNRPSQRTKKKCWFSWKIILSFIPVKLKDLDKLVQLFLLVDDPLWYFFMSHNKINEKNHQYFCSSKTPWFASTRASMKGQNLRPFKKKKSI